MSYAIIVQECVIDGPIVVEGISSTTYQTRDAAEAAAFMLVAMNPCLAGRTSVHEAKRGFGLIFHSCTFNGEIRVGSNVHIDGTSFVGPEIDVRGLRGSMFGVK